MIRWGFFIWRNEYKYMKKLMQLIKEEVVPLSRRQNIVLFIIIACVFQFVLFYAPALADEAVKNAQASGLEEELVSLSPIIKTENLASVSEEILPLYYQEDALALVDSILEASQSSMETDLEETISPPDKKYHVVSTSFHTFTAYNSEVAQTDDTPCITANGFDLCQHGIEDTVAANFLAMGTKIRIPDLYGERIFVVRDRMNKRFPDRVDIWMVNKSDALKFGVKRGIRIEVLEEL